MTLEFPCECRKLLRVKETLAGKRVKCPKCGAVVTAPATAPAKVEETHFEEEKAPPNMPRASNSKLSHAAPPTPQTRGSGLFFPIAAAILGLMLIGSVLAGGWFFLDTRSLQGRLVDVEKKANDAAARVTDVQKQLEAAEQKSRNAVSHADELAKQLAARGMDGKKQIEAAEEKARLAEAKADALAKQLAALAPTKGKEDQPSREKPGDGKAEILIGSWKCIRGEFDGAPAPTELIGKKMVITPEKLLTDQNDQATYTLDATKNPKQIDSKSHDGLKSEGIYKTETDILTICAAIPGKKRPTAFTTKKGDGLLLMVFQRDGDSKTSPAPATDVTFKELRSLDRQGPTAVGIYLVFSPDGKLALSIAGDMQIILSDARTWKVLHRFKAHDGLGATKVAFSSDGKRFLSAGYDGRVWVWDIELRKEIMKFEGHRTGKTFISEGKELHHSPTEILFSPDDKQVLSFNFAQASLWDPATGKEIHRLDPKGYTFARAVYSRDGRWILASTFGEEGPSYQLVVWDARTGKEVRRLAGTIKGDHWLMNGLAVTLSGKHLVACCRDATIRTWEIETGKEIKRIPVTVKDRVMGSALTPDGRLALTWERKHVKKWTTQRIDLGGGRFSVTATEKMLPEGDPNHLPLGRGTRQATRFKNA